MFKIILNKLSKFCAYSHIYKLIKDLLNNRDISEQTKTGRNIALLGFFCPFFWYALFSGAPQNELLVHASHSGIVLLVGLVIMVLSLKQQKE